MQQMPESLSKSAPVRQISSAGWFSNSGLQKSQWGLIQIHGGIVCLEYDIAFMVARQRTKAQFKYVQNDQEHVQEQIFSISREKLVMTQKCTWISCSHTSLPS